MKNREKINRYQLKLEYFYTKTRSIWGKNQKHKKLILSMIDIIFPKVLDALIVM